MFTELCAISNFTFLTGAAHPEEYIERAAALGLAGVAIADVNSVAGIVRAHARAREIARQVCARQALEAREGLHGPPAPRSATPQWACTPRLIPAARLVLRDGLTLTALPEDRQGWARLCRLLTLGRRRAPKGGCELSLGDVLEGAAGLHLLLHPESAPGWQDQARRLGARFGERLHLLLYPRYDGRDAARFDRLARVAARLGLPTVAAACPLMHRASRRRLADVLSAIRLGVTVDRLGRHALPNAEARLRSEAEMRRLFARRRGGACRGAGRAAHLFARRVAPRLPERGGGGREPHRAVATAGRGRP
jgi:DNA polymerase III alpha subunit